MKVWELKTTSGIRAQEAASSKCEGKKTRGASVPAQRRLRETRFRSPVSAMHFFRPLLVSLLLSGSVLAAEEKDATLTPAQQKFRTELAAKVAPLEKKNVSAIVGADGWLFLTSELRFLAQGRFWGDAAARAARSTKAPDPLV